MVAMQEGSSIFGYTQLNKYQITCTVNMKSIFVSLLLLCNHTNVICNKSKGNAVCSRIEGE